MTRQRTLCGLVVVVFLLVSEIASAQTLKFTPTALRFGPVVVNNSSVKTVVVKNNSTTAVTISSVTLGLATDILPVAAGLDRMDTDFDSPKTARRAMAQAVVSVTFSPISVPGHREGTSSVVPW